MRCNLFCLTLLTLVATAFGVAFESQVIDDNRMVELPGIVRYPVKGDKPSGHSKRQVSKTIFSGDNGFSYTIALTIGTPGQSVDLILDTGSWELWVNPVCAKAANPENCAKHGRFTHSQTLLDKHQAKNLTFGTGYAYIEYVSDFVQVGSARLKSQVFGVAKDSAFAENGILGLAPNPDGIGNPDTYVVNSLAKQGFTKSIAFSVDLQAYDSNRGSVVFGGVDLKKFRGSLQRLSLVPASAAPDGQARYWVQLDGVSQTSNGKTTSLVSQQQTVIVDTGSSVSSFSASVVQQLLQAFPNATRHESGNYIVDCSLRQKNDTVDFRFGDTIIRAPYADFIHQFDGNICSPGFDESSRNISILGASFLRSAYVVFDQTNKELAVAQADDCGTHLIAIGPGPAGPLTGECGKALGSNPTGGINGFANPTNGPIPAGGQPTHLVTAGVARIGVSVAAVALYVATVLLL